MKKVLIWLFAMVFMLSLTFIGIGCKEEAAPSVEEAVEEEAVEEEAVEEIVVIQHQQKKENQLLTCQFQQEGY